MLIRKLSAIAAISGICTLASTGFADDTAELKALLLKQQKQLEALQQKVEKQETVHNEALTHYIRNEIDRALEAKGSSLLSLGSNVENLTIKGDLRVRYEMIDNDDSGNQDHFRQRFRLGFLWKTNEGWEIGAGLSTGHNDSTNTAHGASGAKGGTSGNDTYSRGGAFNNGDIYLDHAYAKHNWENTSLTLGQHKNPFISSSILWDSDVRFVGVTGQWTSPDSGFFATGGAYVVETFDDPEENDDANLLALQLGYETNGLTATLAYYHFDSAASNQTVVDPDRSGSDDIKLLSAYLEYAGKTDSFKYKVFGEYTHNLGADNTSTAQAAGKQENEDVAYVLGAEIGVDKWKFKYAFARFESDSAFGPLTDSTFGASVGTSNNSTNVEGHIFGVSYNVTKNFQLSAKYIMAEEVEDSGTNASDGEVLQINAYYKF